MRIQICIAVMINILIMAFTVQPVSPQENITLTKDGFSRHTIVLSTEASPTEKHAARELQKFLKMICGATLPVRRDNEKLNGPMILVGNGPLSRRIDASIDFDELGREGFIIRTYGEDVMIAGGRLRGTMYGAYRFLKLLGCRWFTPELSHIPRLSTLQIPVLDIKEIPVFTMRNMDWRCGNDPDWASRNYRNAAARLGVLRGGTEDYRGVHTHFRLVRPEDLFNDHPEYYSLITGIRKWQYAQLCTTNPEVAKIAARSMVEWIADEPGGAVYSLGQEDWRNFCLCPLCTRINEREESPAGSNIYFANAVAERVGKIFPDILVGTHAYQYTEKPPKYLKTRDNVGLRLAIIERCHAHPLEVCPHNTHVAENVRQWGSKCNHIFLKDYVNNFAHLLQPFPDWWALAEDLKLFTSRNVEGILLQGNSYMESGALSEMQSYCEAQMLWDPFQNIFDVIDEFLNAYYGPAAPAMRRYIDLLQNDVRHLDNHFTLFSPPTVSYLAPGLIREAEKLFDEAERAVRGLPDYGYRVEESRLILRYVKLTQPIEHRREGILFLPDWNSSSYEGLGNRELSDFLERAGDHEITSLDEWGKMFTRSEHMRVNMGIHTLLPVESDVLKMEILPTVAGCIFSLFDKRQGMELLAHPRIEDSRYSITGGFSFGPSRNEIRYPYYIDEPGGGRLIMNGFLSNNAHFRVHNSFSEKRDLFLPDDKKEIRIIQTLTALMDIGRPQSMTGTGEFLLGDLKKIEIGISGEEGRYRMVPLPSEPDERGRIRMSFRRREIQNGSVCILNVNENRGIVITFNPDEIESCLISVNAERNSVGLSISGNQITYERGDKHSISYSIRFADNIRSMLQ